MSKNKKRLLYIHGYKGSTNGVSFNRLKKYAKDDYEMFAIDYDETRPIDTIRKILYYVYDNNIDIIIGSSLGGFLTMNCYEIPRIVINPCMIPSEELPKIGYDGPENDYKYLEDGILHRKAGRLEKHTCIGCFAENDELLGAKYINTFKKKGYKTYNIDGGHHVSESAAKEIIEKILPEFINNLNKLSDSLKGEMNSHLFDD